VTSVTKNYSIQLTQAHLTRELKTLQKLKDDPYKQIWDFGYISSSDEEDDDDSSSDSDSEEEKKKPPKEIKPDVVDLLIEADKTLLHRDFKHRLRRFQQTKKAKEQLRIYPEQAEKSESYKKWFDPDSEDVYFAMNSRHRTSYRQGDQLFNSYGLRTNRFLIVNYGFTIR
jgi:hypothetical protein